MGVGGQRHTPAALAPGMTRYSFIGGWVGHCDWGTALKFVERISVASVSV